jgi:gluconolactonase
VTPQAIEVKHSALGGLISPDAALELVATGFGFTEGVTWATCRGEGCLLFSDIPANVIYRWSPRDGVAIHMEKSGYPKPDHWRVGMEFTNGKPPDDPGFEKFTMCGSNGLALDPQGRLIICTWAGRSIVRVEADGRRTTLADRFEGKRFGGPNDVVVRKDGAIYFTDTFGGMLKYDKDPSREIEVQSIYRIQDGEVTRVIDDIRSTNGLGFSPDEKVFYANGSIDRFIRRYDVMPDGTFANGALLIDLNPEPRSGITDGMKVDERGNLWTTGPGGIWIVSPSGEPLGRIPLPEDGTNVVFGDDDRKTLYISAHTSIYKIRTHVRGAIG